MKKAYVKAKPKSVKKPFKKAYVITAAVSAVLCAAMFSFLFGPDDDIESEIKIEVPDVKVDETAQVSESLEIEIPTTEEVKIIPEIEINSNEPETEETGSIFSTDVKIMMPAAGDVINEFSGTKPVKSKTMGDWRVHSGIDIKAPKGESVKAPADGKIIEAYNSKLTGNTVSIEHGDGFVSTLYNLDSIAVETGNKVKSGDTIGTVGTSAALESLEDPHVHFELKKEGKTVNPKEYVE